MVLDVRDIRDEAAYRAMCVITPHWEMPPYRYELGDLHGLAIWIGVFVGGFAAALGMPWWGWLILAVVWIAGWVLWARSAMRAHRAEVDAIVHRQLRSWDLIHSIIDRTTEKGQTNEPPR